MNGVKTHSNFRYVIHIMYIVYIYIYYIYRCKHTMRIKPNLNKNKPTIASFRNIIDIVK